MALVLNTNIAPMSIQPNPAATQEQAPVALQSPSSDLSVNAVKVNSEKDEGADLRVAESQAKDTRGLNMAVRNASDGISMAKTAEGALDEIGQNLQRVKTLAVESAKTTNSDADREVLQEEVNELTQEVSRIVDTTEFNGKKLLNEEAFSSALQVGVKGDLTTRVTTGLEGGLQAQQGMDKVTFSGSSESFNVSQADREAGFTESAAVGEAFLKKVGFDKNSGLPTDEFKKGLANQLKAVQGDSASLAEAMIKIGMTEPPGIKFTLNGVDFAMQLDGTPTAIKSLSALYGGTQINLASSSNPPAETDAINLATDFRSAKASEEGFAPEKLLVSYQAKNADSATNGNTVAIENSNALFNILNKDSGTSPSVNVSTQAAAQTAIGASTSAIDSVSEIRGTFSEVIKRFEAAISGKNTYSESSPAARNPIQNAKIAVETANQAKQQVLQQAGVTSLSQGNASAESVLGLLA